VWIVGKRTEQELHTSGSDRLRQALGELTRCRPGYFERRRSLLAHHRPEGRLVKPLTPCDLRLGLGDAPLRRRITEELQRVLTAAE
jgi:hypothetical protein